MPQKGRKRRKGTEEGGRTDNLDDPRNETPLQPRPPILIQLDQPLQTQQTIRERIPARLPDHILQRFQSTSSNKFGEESPFLDQGPEGEGRQFDDGGFGAVELFDHLDGFNCRGGTEVESARKGWEPKSVLLKAARRRKEERTRSPFPTSSTSSPP